MTIATDYLTLSQIDAMLQVRPIAVPRCTFVGVQSYPGGSILLVNFGHDTKSLVSYDDEEPVIFSEVA